MTDRDDRDLFEVIDAMIRYGGSFVQALGELLRLADPENQRRLVAAFPDYIETYRELADLAAARHAATAADGAKATRAKGGA